MPLWPFAVCQLWAFRLCVCGRSCLLFWGIWLFLRWWVACEFFWELDMASAPIKSTGGMFTLNRSCCVPSTGLELDSPAKLPITQNCWVWVLGSTTLLRHLSQGIIWPTKYNSAKTPLKVLFGEDHCSVAEWLWPFFQSAFLKNWEFLTFSQIVGALFCFGGNLWFFLIIRDFPNDFLVASRYFGLFFSCKGRFVLLRARFEIWWCFFADLVCFLISHVFL